MAIAQVAGTTNTQGAGTSVVLTYSPTAGNTVVFFLSLATAGSAPSVKDNNNNSLTAGPTVAVTAGNLFSFYGTAITGATSYTASWTGAAAASGALEEYSGVQSVNASLAGNTASGTSATATITVTTEDSNDWVVCSMASFAQVITATVGNSRQQVATVFRQNLIDNTVVGPGSVTCTGTLTSGSWGIALIELRTAGGGGGGGTTSWLSKSKAGGMNKYSITSEEPCADDRDHSVSGSNRKLGMGRAQLENVSSDAEAMCGDHALGRKRKRSGVQVAA